MKTSPINSAIYAKIWLNRLVFYFKFNTDTGIQKGSEYLLSSQSHLQSNATDLTHSNCFVTTGSFLPVSYHKQISALIIVLIMKTFGSIFENTHNHARAGWNDYHKCLIYDNVNDSKMKVM